MNPSSQIAAAQSAAEEAETRPEWADFAAYCRLRERGLRAQAFVRLDAFIAVAAAWGFEAQRQFVLWLCSRMDVAREGDCGLYPHPLRERLVAPFFAEWLRREPSHDEAHALCAQYAGTPGSHQRAVDLNPRNQRARRALVTACIDDIWYATHHLPHFFIGDEREVKETALAAHNHVSHIDEAGRQGLLNQLEALETLLDDWIAFKAESGTDFVAWCRQKGRRHGWTKAYFFER